MKFSRSLTLIMLAGLTLLGGCVDSNMLKTAVDSFTLRPITNLFSDLYSTDVVKQKLETTKFSANCKLDIDKFSQIMYENIEEPIDCLGENLNLFIKIVETDKPGYLSRIALEEFLRKNRTDVSQDALRALKAVFDINFLIFGEDPNYISKVNVDKIIDFAIMFNNKASLNFSIFQNTNSLEPKEYEVLRNRINDNSLFLTNTLSHMFNRTLDGKVRSLNILDLLESFTTSNNRSSMEKVKKFLFVKKVIVGGAKNIITHKELDHLIQNFNNLSTFALDVTRFRNIKLDDQHILEFLEKPLDNLNKVIFTSQYRDMKEHFFDIQEAIDAFKLFVTVDSFDIEKFKNLIVEGKQILIGGNKKQVNAGEFQNLIKHGKEILTSGKTFYQIYRNFRSQLDLNRPLTVDFTLVQNVYHDRLPQLATFSRIAKKYRFFKGEALSATYDTGYNRNPRAIFEIYLFEYLLKLVFAHKTIENDVVVEWASASNGLGGKSMNADQIYALIKRFEKELIEMDVLSPKKAKSTSESVALLGSLFQYQSDDNKLLDVNEAAEFAVSVFTSITISNDMMDFYKEKSGCRFDEFDRVEPDCFKANFFKALCSKDYKKYYPKMFESLNASGALNCEIEMTPPNQAFLDTSILAARTCPVYPDDGNEIPYSKGDILVIFLTMMHVETTILKWDVKGTPNNIMDPREVMDAYPIYSPALDGFLEDMPNFIKALKKQIYQFLIKYEEIPSAENAGKFLKFLLGNKAASANRKTIASILAAISKENLKRTPVEEQFDCNSLHRPFDVNPEPVPATSFKAYKVQSDFWTNLQYHKDYKSFINNPNLIEE